MQLWDLVFSPILPIAVQGTLSSYAASNTKQGSPLRYILFLPVLSIFILFTSTQLPLNHGWTGRILAPAVFWTVINYFEKLLWRGWDYDNYNAKTEGGTNSQLFSGSRADFAAEIDGGPRGIGKRWEVKNVPLHSDSKGADYVPSFNRFVLLHSTYLVVFYFLTQYSTNIQLSLDKRLLSPDRVPIFTRNGPAFSPQDLQARSISTAACWVMNYSMLQFLYSIICLGTAAVDSKSIGNCRPIFGSVKHAYSVRNFWGKFWHQNLRCHLEGTADFVAHGVLRLPTTGLAQRYTKIFWSFFLSGVSHIFSDVGGGVPWNETTTLHFFVIQAVGIVIEDAVKAVWRRQHLIRSTTFERVVGYMWVALFLLWTTPAWYFPVTTHMVERDSKFDFRGVLPLIIGGRANST